MNIRGAERDEISALAQLWYESWRDAHATIVPEALVRVRTLENFRERMERRLDAVRVAGPRGAPLGFYLLEGDELEHFYVAASARGTGLAAMLMADAEAMLRERGVTMAWLGCAIGNERAARFYEKSGWRRTGTVVSRLETTDGPFELDVWRYEKPLTSLEPSRVLHARRAVLP